MSSAPNAAVGSGSGSGDSLYSSGASNLDILETVGSDILESHSSSPPSPDSSALGGGDNGTAIPPAAGADGGAEAAITKPEWFETAPQEFKDLMAHQNISAVGKKWLEETFGELNGFKGSPIGTKETVQELSELYPGGIDDIREAHQHAQEFVKEMAQFNSGDPGQQTELLATLIQQNPDAFVSLVPAAMNLLKQTLRDDYTAVSSSVAHDHLETITDGKFASFFDSVKSMADKYNGLLETNPDEAAKLASKLGGAALQMADWWGSAKNKLGYGEQKSGAQGGLNARQPVVSPQGDPKELSYAQRDAAFFETNYSMKHDALVNPLIASQLTRELAARKLDLPASWQGRVNALVAQGIKSNLAQDKTYTALETRIYRRGAPSDPRKWDNSDAAARTLLAAARQRAEKLIPTLLKRALDDIAQLRGGTPVPKPQPGANNRGGAGAPAAGGNQAQGWEEDLKAGKISGPEAVLRMSS